MFFAKGSFIMNNDIKTKTLSSYEIVMNSLKLYWMNIKYIIPVCLAVYIPINILMMFLPGDLLERLSDMKFMTDDPGAAYYMRYVFVLFGIMVVFMPLIAGALSYITVQSIEGKPVKITGILDSSFVRWGKLVYTSALYCFFVFAFSFLVFPIFYFGVFFMLHQCIAAISNKYGFSALLISRVLMKGKWLRGCFLFLMIVITILCIQYLLGIIIYITGIPYSAVSQFIINVAAGCLNAFSYIAVCLFYINIHYNFNNKEQLI